MHRPPSATKQVSFTPPLLIPTISAHFKSWHALSCPPLTMDLNLSYRAQLMLTKDLDSIYKALVSIPIQKSLIPILDDPIRKLPSFSLRSWSNSN